jgi:hypothetical protein
MIQLTEQEHEELMRVKREYEFFKNGVRMCFEMMIQDSTLRKNKALRKQLVELEQLLLRNQ